MDDMLGQGENSMGMTDLQFMSYKEERDKRESLEKENFKLREAKLLSEIAALREENARLKNENRES